MDFDWLDSPFDLRKIMPKEIEESFEDPFSLRLLPDGVGDDEKARYFNLGKSINDRGIFTVFWFSKFSASLFRISIFGFRIFRVSSAESVRSRSLPARR